MKKTIYAILLFSFINIQLSYSQVEFGDQITEKSELVYKTNNEYIFFDSNTKEFIKLSKDLKIISKTPIIQEGKPKQNFSISGYTIKDTYYYYSYYTNIEKKQNFYFLETFNLNNLTSNNDKRKISENGQVEMFETHKLYKKSQCALISTPDSSKIILIHNLNNRYDTILCKIFDKKGTYISEYTINKNDFEGRSYLLNDSDFRNSESEYYHSQYFCDNKCNVFTFDYIIPLDITKKNREKYYYKIYGFYENGTKMILNTFSYENHDISCMQIKILPDNSILAFGFYKINGLNQTNSNLGGIFYKKLESFTFKEIYSKKVEFTSDYINKFLSPKEIEIYNKTATQQAKLAYLYSYLNPKIIVLKDNSFYLMGEQESYSNSLLCAGNIFVSYISNSGELQWMDKIEKLRQIFPTLQVHSYNTTIENFNLSLIYNSQIDTEGYRKISITSKLFNVKITPKGLSTPQLLYDFKTNTILDNTYLSLNTDKIWKISNNEFLCRFYSYKGKSMFNYGKITISN